MNMKNKNYNMKKFLKLYFEILWLIKYDILKIWFFFFILSLISKSPFGILYLLLLSFSFVMTLVLSALL